MGSTVLKLWLLKDVQLHPPYLSAAIKLFANLAVQGHITRGTYNEHLSYNEIV